MDDARAGCPPAAARPATAAGTWTATTCPARSRAEARRADVVEPYVALVDQRLEPGPGERGQPSGQPRVEPLALGLVVRRRARAALSPEGFLAVRPS